MTNKIGVNKTFYTMHHELKLTLCRNKMNFQLPIEGKSLNKLLWSELHFRFNFETLTYFLWSAVKW